MCLFSLWDLFLEGKDYFLLHPHCLEQCLAQTVPKIIRVNFYLMEKNPTNLTKDPQFHVNKNYSYNLYPNLSCNFIVP